jgi:hypothetical protein
MAYRCFRTVQLPEGMVEVDMVLLLLLLLLELDVQVRGLHHLLDLVAGVVDGAGSRRLLRLFLSLSPGPDLFLRASFGGIQTHVNFVRSGHSGSCRCSGMIAGKNVCSGEPASVPSARPQTRVLRKRTDVKVNQERRTQLRVLQDLLYRDTGQPALAV